jgi:hypothetical protein
MKSKNYQRVFKASTFTVLALTLMLVGHFACQENDPDEKPFKGNDVSDLSSANQSPTGTAASSRLHERVGAQIPLEVATRWKSAYKKNHATTAESHFFGSATFQRLLHQPNVAGVSIEYALNDEGEPQLLLVAVDKNGRKMTSATEDGYEDASRVCPPDCSNAQ